MRRAVIPARLFGLVIAVRALLRTRLAAPLRGARRASRRGAACALLGVALAAGETTQTSHEQEPA